MLESLPGCPVCRAAATRHFLNVGGRDYFRCRACEATFLAASQRPSRQSEYRHYLSHENEVDDAGYRRFLSKLADPLLERLERRRSRRPGERLRGLDYGCGPGPALAAMLREAGHEVAVYDPHFEPDTGPLRHTYDFVTCTETAEHFHRPADEFERLDRMLEPGGWLAIMTCFQSEDALFAGWHYRKDPTHVVFYRETTLRRVAALHGWDCEIPLKDVALMFKPESGRMPCTRSRVERSWNPSRRSGGRSGRE
ncbi:MAG: class I SAM-dependent methyltransferase [Gammaproteobacteria bacterium]|nr:class I SAM-dependent methyltransferase [Gammaproteobacteria bacterium]